MSTKAESANRQDSGRLAWLLALLAIGSSLAAFALAIFFLITIGERQNVGLDDFLIPLPTTVFAIVGALIAARHPRNPIGWIFIAVGWFYGLDLTLDVYQAYGPEMGMTGSLPPLAHNLWVPRILLPTLFVFLIFPNGTHLSPRWRIIFWSAAFGLIVQHFALAFHPGPVPQFDIETNPKGIASLAGMLDIILQVTRPLLGIGLVGSFAAFVIRLRRSRGVERQQMKWLSYAISLASLSFGFGALSWTLWPDDPFVTGLSERMTELSVLGIAVATGIAILRYRLYDIDFIINRTLVYGSLTMLVIGIYILVVGALGTFFQAQGNLAIALLATGIVAVLFQPLRERLQRGVNRLIFGERDDPIEALSRMGRQLETAVPTNDVLPMLAETIAQTLKLPYVAIELRAENEDDVAAEYGDPSQELAHFPLVYQGESIGRLMVALRSPGSSFSPAEMRLLRNIARQAGAAVHAVQLMTDLQRSRRQLVAAREEERLRLRRDLHDGLGPALASVVWQADSARDLVYRDPSGAEQLLESSIEQAQSALADIRRLVYGLRPPALDELGLAGALEQAAQQHEQTAVTIEAPALLPSLPAAVEVAAYRIAQEALKNAVEHGRADNCLVGLALDGNLCLTIADDGLGLPEMVTTGVGLVSMRERAEELGGMFKIRPRPGGGTKVEVSLPLELGG